MDNANGIIPLKPRFNTMFEAIYLLRGGSKRKKDKEQQRRKIFHKYMIKISLFYY
ncbi:hypothetical protein Barb6_01704 [Bacteroidales bacterium Barb6]|nr:hypothetical protein Barb6_01704 [Bacteroidales bacterium Barb6]